MKSFKEKPGVQTPWTTINQLLKADERFSLDHVEGTGILLAPKEISQLAALLYFLKQENIVYSISGRGTSFSWENKISSIIVSTRAFNQVVIHDEGMVEVGAGATLNQIHGALLEYKREISFEGDLFGSPKQSLGSILLAGKTSGLYLKGENTCEIIQGVEIVSLDGDQIKWGSCHRSSGSGPTLHKLLWGIQSFQGILVKVFMKTQPLPPKRLQLTWTFRNQKELWKQFEDLNLFATTWERLDCVISGKLEEQGYIFAQISGFEEELEAFTEYCPNYKIARESNESSQLKTFFRSKQLKAYSALATQRLEPGEYFWYHGLENRGWWLNQGLIQTSLLPEKNAIDSQNLWKERFNRAMS